MAIIILRRHGLDEMEPVARFEDGAWTEAADGFRYAEDDYFDGYDEEMILAHFDGPDLFAIPAEDFRDKDDRRGQRTLGELDKLTSGMSDVTEQNKESSTPDELPLQERIVRLLRPRTDEIVSSAWIADRIDAPDDEVTEALQELIKWGEVELIVTTGIAGRVQLKESVDGAEPAIWMTYVADSYEERRAIRLFSKRSYALGHLKQVVGEPVKDLERIDYLNAVWKGPAGDGSGYLPSTAVLRREPIHNEIPHQDIR